MMVTWPNNGWCGVKLINSLPYTFEKNIFNSSSSNRTYVSIEAGHGIKSDKAGVIVISNMEHVLNHTKRGGVGRCVRASR